MSIDYAKVLITTVLVSIFIAVLILPFLVKFIEKNLEVFLFSMGVLAITVDTFFADIDVVDPGEHMPMWHWSLVLRALEDPIKITVAVLIAGLIFHFGQKYIIKSIDWLKDRLHLRLLVFLMVLVLGLISSVISAIVASLILVELIYVLKMPRHRSIIIVVISCFSIGMGAALTPLGEPLSTIVIEAKLQTHFYYLIYLIGPYIIPGIFALAIFAGFLAGKPDGNSNFAKNAIEEDTIKHVLLRALKVYIFVMALVFLGTGFIPLIDWYVQDLSPIALYWVNMVSAILDNATLVSAEISVSMTHIQIASALMGLLIAGGILIPGNIPNIISAGKLNISSKEWAKIGVPIGLILMGIYFVIIFVIGL